MITGERLRRKEVNLMKLTIISDRQTADQLEKDCLETGSVKQISKFTQINPALVHILNDGTSGVVLDFDALTPQDLEFLADLRSKIQNVPIIAMSATDSFAASAYAIEAAGYLVKPWRKEELQQIVDKLSEDYRRQRVFVRTFGHFDVFIDDEPIYFHNLKAKELLAFLIDQRGTVTMEAAINILWEDHRYDENVKQLYRKAVNYLNGIMRQYQLNFFVSNRRSCYIKMREIQCDYYQLIEGDKRAQTEYNGEYMFEYAWAEGTVFQIERYIRYWQDKRRAQHNL